MTDAVTILAAGASGGEGGPFPVWAFAAAFPLFFAGMWVATCFLIARLGGWSALAAAYAAAGPFEGRLWRFRSGALRRLSGYNGCLTVGAGKRGLYLAVMLLFRAGHPPLFVPWSDITVTTETDRLFFLKYSFVQFRFAHVPDVPLRLPEKLAREIAGALGMVPPGAPPPGGAGG